MKSTFKDKINITHIPEHLICLKLYSDGNFKEIYNGPGNYVDQNWSHLKDWGAKAKIYQQKN